MATIAEIRNLEAELQQKRSIVAAALKAERMKRELSLRQVGRRVNIAPSGLLEIENGERWRTDTVARVVRFYERTSGEGKANGQKSS
jgi:predicted transcriptional regulator